MAGEASIPVSVKGAPRAVNLERGIASLEWELVGGFSREWAHNFREDGGGRTRQGSEMYVTMDGPKVRNDAVVEWAIPEADYADAHEYVKSCVEATNIAIETAKSSQRTAAEQKARAARQSAMDLAALQERLNELG